MRSPADAPSPVDARASVGTPSNSRVPVALSDAVWKGSVHEVAPGRILLTIPGLARALIREDGQVTVEAEPAASPADLRWLEDRPVREARDLLAGHFALRAAAVVIGGNAVALVGHAACGKSIAAAALGLRGHPVLADHRLELDVARGVRAEFTSPELDLWPAAVALLGLPPHEGAVIRPALAKRAHRFPAGDSAPLRLMVVLEQEAGVGKPRATRLYGGEAIQRVDSATAARLLLEPLALRADHFAWTVQIAKAAEVVKVEVDRDLMDPGEVADAVEELVV